MRPKRRAMTKCASYMLGAIDLRIALALLIALTPELTAPSEPSYLAWIRVSDLASKCNAAKAWEAAYCVGYVVGVADVANNDPSQLRICIPPAITQAQIRSVVVQYLAQHPEEGDYAAFSSVRIALRQSFPCGARQQM